MMILRFLCKCKLQTLIKNEQMCTTSFQILKRCLLPIRSYRTKRITTDSSFTVSYLKNTCGLSGKSLVRASNLVNFESSERPDSVLKLLQSFRFSKAHISKIIAGYPRLLLYDAQNSLKPKLDFLFSISNYEALIIEVVTRDPIVLQRSLNYHLIPWFNLLIPLMGSRQDAVVALRSCPSIFSGDISSLVHNVKLLQTLGVSHSQIVKMITKQYNLLNYSRDKFCNVLLKVYKMGFNPSSTSFRHAVNAMITVNDSAWESKFEMYRRFGFSNNEILSMLKKQPLSINISVDKIKKVVEFYLTKLRWSPSSLSAKPIVLMFSLEKRIIPRCSVLQALVLRNRINNNLMLTTILGMTDGKFLKNYVTEHKDEVPEVLDAYQGRLRFDEYNFHLVGKKQDVAL